VTSELEIKPEAIQTEEETSGTGKICHITSVCSLNPEAALADDEGTEQVFKIQAVLSDHPVYCLSIVRRNSVVMGRGGFSP
jgi:hypothetical protein